MTSLRSALARFNQWPMFTLLLSRLTGPSGRVMAFEPNPELFHVLDSNCPGNRLATGLPEGSFHREIVDIATLDEVPGGGRMVDDVAYCRGFSSKRYEDLLAIGTNRL